MKVARARALQRREGDGRAEGGVAGSSPAHRYSSLRVALKSAPYSRATGQPGSLARWVVSIAWISLTRERKPVELVEEMQDDRNAFVVDAKVQLEIPDQPGPARDRHRRTEERCRWRAVSAIPHQSRLSIVAAIKMRSADEFLGLPRSHSHRLPWTVRHRLPLRDEFLELPIRLLRKHPASV